MPPSCWRPDAGLGRHVPGDEDRGKRNPVLTFRGAIAVGAGLALLAVARFAGHSLRVPAGNRRGVILAGLYNVFGGHVMATLSTQLISSGQTALIMYTMPIWTFLIGIPC